MYKTSTEVQTNKMAEVANATSRGCYS